MIDLAISRYFLYWFSLLVIKKCYSLLRRG
nr:MAG TPA: hypothetical protein [Caudoviricetes sp.]